jgi:hypothetical protein
MFAMMGLLAQGANEIEYFPETAYDIADAMLKARTLKPEPEVEEGIVAVKPRKRSVK